MAEPLGRSRLIKEALLIELGQGLASRQDPNLIKAEQTQGPQGQESRPPDQHDLPNETGIIAPAQVTLAVGRPQAKLGHEQQEVPVSCQQELPEQGR